MEKYLVKNLFTDNKIDEIRWLWDNESHDGCNEWDYFYFMNAFYKQKDYEECLIAYDECSKKFPDFDKINDKMGWSVYYLELKDMDLKNGDVEKFIERADYVLSHCGNSSYSPRNLLTLKIVKCYTDNNIPIACNWEKVENYLSQIDTSSLSQDEHYFFENDEKKFYGSDYETWYNKMTKALLENKKFKECYDTCAEALNTISKFHNNSDLWFKYRMAKALNALGKTEDAIELIKEIISGRFSHWCLYECLFDSCIAIGDVESALTYGAKCSIADCEHKMRVTFYGKYADFLERQQMQWQANLLRRLVLIIYSEQGWALNKNAEGWRIPNDVADMDKASVIAEISEFWNNYADRDKVVGRITRIIGDGFSGFISDVDHNSYYFNTRDFKSNRSYVVEGQNVKFRVIEQFDKKKNQMGKVAVDIRAF